MSREEVSAFLRNFQLQLITLHKQIDQGLQKLPEVKREDLPRFLQEQKLRFLRFQQEQMEDWDKFVEETGLQVEGEEGEGPARSSSEAEAGGSDSRTPLPFNVQLRSLEHRVAAMGGIPALGALVLPRMTPAQKAGLVTTSSPAAVEILRGRLGSDADAATPLKRSSSGEADAAVTPLVTLRKTALGGGGAGGAGAVTPGAAPPNSELAAAIQRRAQRAQQQEQASEEAANGAGGD